PPTPSTHTHGALRAIAHHASSAFPMLAHTSSKLARTYAPVSDTACTHVSGSLPACLLMPQAHA
ncbi:unnamed protein product, partial [Dovyalis caffra]